MCLKRSELQGKGLGVDVPGSGQRNAYLLTYLVTYLLTYLLP